MKTAPLRIGAMFLPYAVAALVVGPATAQPTPVSAPATPPKTAQAILAKAEAESATTKRPILLLFGATWCVFCTRLESFLHSPPVEPIFTKNYVLVQMDVLERSGNLAKETPGGTAMMDQYTDNFPSFPPGSHEGLPYYVVLNSQGKKLADSGDIGYPGGDQGLERFSTLLKNTAPQMTPAQRAKIIAAVPQAHLSADGVIRF